MTSVTAQTPKSISWWATSQESFWPLMLLMLGSLDFLHKSEKGEGQRGKGSVLSPSPLTFTLFPLLQKALLQEVYCLLGEKQQNTALYDRCISRMPDLATLGFGVGDV